jgi:hypothetical protein
MTENKTKQKNIFKAIFTKSDPDSAIPTLAKMSVPITTDVVSSNLDQGEVYNIM